MPEISFRLHKGLIYLPITLMHRGQKLILENCIFDIGSAGTTFDIDRVSKIGIQSTLESHLKRLVTVGGYQTVFTHQVEALILGNKTLSPVEIEVGSLHSKFHIDGILGTDIMQQFDWELQFSQNKIKIRS